MVWPAAIAACLLLVGLTLSLVGLIGRRVNDHPHCRRCRFDLSGLVAPVVPGPGPRCPECGQDVSLPGSVRRGLRTRRRGMLLAGAALLTVLAVLVGTTVWLAASTSAYAKAPTHVLIWLAPYLDGKQLDLAAKELKARAVRGELSSTQWSSLADSTLPRQSDRSRAWRPGLGELFELGAARNSIPRARFDEYLDHAVHLAVRTRPTVGRGDPLPLEVHMDARLGWTGALRVRAKLVDVIVGGKRIDGDRFGFEVCPLAQSYSPYTPDLAARATPETVPANDGGPPGSRTPPWEDATVEASVGPTTVETVWAVFVGPAAGASPGGTSTSRMLTPPARGPRRAPDAQVLDGFKAEVAGDTWFSPSGPGSSPFSWFRNKKKPPPMEGRVYLARASSPIRVAARSTDPGWIRDPQEAASIAKGVSAQRWTSSTSGSAPANQAYDTISLSSASGTAALAGALYEVLDDGTEELVGRVVIERAAIGPNASSVGTNTSMPLDLARLVNAQRSFVLRPEAETARSLIDPERVLGVPVWFVGVQNSAGSWRPTAGTTTAPSGGGAERGEPSAGQK